MMNIAQEIFLLFFAINHGVMLATLPKGAFPTDTAFSRRIFSNAVGKWIDTKKFWNISKKRLLLSFLLVNFLPLTYFISVFFLLLSYDVSEKASFMNGLKILLLPFLALATHGFYRIYFAVILKFNTHFCEENLLKKWEEEGRDLESPVRHAVGSVLYFIPIVILTVYKIYPLLLAIINSF